MSRKRWRGSIASQRRQRVDPNYPIADWITRIDWDAVGRDMAEAERNRCGEIFEVDGGDMDGSQLSCWLERGHEGQHMGGPQA